MIAKIIKAVVVAVVVTLGCLFVGSLLEMLNVQVAVAAGTFLRTYATVIGILSGLWYFFAR